MFAGTRPNRAACVGPVLSGSDATATGTIPRMDGRIAVMTTQAVRLFLARLLVGVLVSTQVAIASYACPGMRAMAPAHDQPDRTVAAMSDQGGTGRMGSEAAAALRSDGMGTEYGGMDPMVPNLCVAHCQFGQQNTDSTSAQPLPVALLSSLYTLSPLDERVESARPPPGASGPPPAAGPPHAILHCCWRN